MSQIVPFVSFLPSKIRQRTVLFRPFSKYFKHFINNHVARTKIKVLRSDVVKTRSDEKVAKSQLIEQKTLMFCHGSISITVLRRPLPLPPLNRRESPCIFV